MYVESVGSEHLKKSDPSWAHWHKGNGVYLRCRCSRYISLHHNNGDLVTDWGIRCQCTVNSWSRISSRCSSCSINHCRGYRYSFSWLCWFCRQKAAQSGVMESSQFVVSQTVFGWQAACMYMDQWWQCRSCSVVGIYKRHLKKFMHQKKSSTCM